MPLNFTAAPSSRVTKRSHTRNPLLKRSSSSSSFAEYSRRKPVSRSGSKNEEVNDEIEHCEDRLQDLSLVTSLVPGSEVRNVRETLERIRFYMFDPLPESGGFNSTRIAEILNFRQALAPVVTVSHIHALTASSTSVEREISGMIRAGTIQKLVIPGRGLKGSNIGEGLCLTEDMEQLLQARNIPKQTLDKFLEDLRNTSLSQALRTQKYTMGDIRLLMSAGFLTAKSANHLLNPFSTGHSSLSGTATAISTVSKAASGSLAAVGGEHAISNAGGNLRHAQRGFPMEHGSQYSIEAFNLQLSIPGMGQFLKLVEAARNHLVSLIQKTSYHELPLSLLKERWEGAIPSEDAASKAKKYRGEFGGVLPARTRKYKQFYGISFQWVLAECFGAGLIELFETGSVGQAARLR